MKAEETRAVYSRSRIEQVKQSQAPLPCQRKPQRMKGSGDASQKGRKPYAPPESYGLAMFNPTRRPHGQKSKSNTAVNFARSRVLSRVDFVQRKIRTRPLGAFAFGRQHDFVDM